MMIIEDTRNQQGKHDLKREYFERHGITVVRSKMYVGDYTLPTDQSVCIDTKNSIQELVSDICGKSHTRFRDELVRAQEAGIKLIVLVENDVEYVNKARTIKNDVVRSVNDLFRWKNPRLFIMGYSNQIIGYHKNGRPKFRREQKFPNATKGATLAKAVITMQHKYGVTFDFCTPSEAGARIVELLGGAKDEMR